VDNLPHRPIPVPEVDLSRPKLDVAAGQNPNAPYIVLIEGELTVCSEMAMVIIINVVANDLTRKFRQSSTNTR
jgi:hypothetical protein